MSWGSRVHDYYVIRTKSKQKKFYCSHLRLGIESTEYVMVQHFSIWKLAQNMLGHLVRLVVRKVCNVLKVVTLVGGMTFVLPRLRRLWWCDILFYPEMLPP